MKTIELEGNSRITFGGTEIEVPFRNGFITFSLPLRGPGSYHEFTLHNRDKQKLLPTTAQVLSLLEVLVQNEDQVDCSKALDILYDPNNKGHKIWTATEILACPEGVFFYDNVDRTMPSSEKGLRDMVQRNDKRVRFRYVRKSSVTEGFLPLDDFLSHPYTVAQIGKDMIPTARRLINDVFGRSKACVYGPSELPEEGSKITHTAIHFDYKGRFCLEHMSPLDDNGYAPAIVKNSNDRDIRK